VSFIHRAIPPRRGSPRAPGHARVPVSVKKRCDRGTIDRRRESIGGRTRWILVRRIWLAAGLLSIACTRSLAGGDPPPPAAGAVAARSPAPARAANPRRPVPAVGDPAAAGQVVRALVVSRVGHGPASDRAKHARAGDAVTLYAVAEVQDGRARRYYSDAGTIALGRRRIATRPWSEAPAVHVAWNKVEPAEASMSNTASGAFRFEPVTYRATPMATDAGRTQVAADVHPTLTPDHGGGVGTMRFQVVLTGGGRRVASPGPKARRGRGSRGLTDAVHRISIRRDDTYLGYLTELYGQPYIWASAGLTDKSHQSERLEGADCADFVVYGARRLGLRVPYTWTEGLPRYTRTIARGEPGDDGVYRDRHGTPIPFPKVGDLILFPRHVGVLTADRGTPGVLDEDDVVMHALLDTPKEVRIADSGYGGLPIRILRWPARR
jgi:hypothetical protein